MKKTVVVAGLTVLFGMLAVAGCVVVDDGGGGGGDACEAISCQDALVSGLSVQGDAICDAVSDGAYGDVFSCGCGTASAAGACEVECGDSLCVDLGESPDCGDCLNSLCTPEHDACFAN